MIFIYEEIRTNWQFEVFMNAYHEFEVLSLSELKFFLKSKWVNVDETKKKQKKVSE